MYVFFFIKIFSGLTFFFYFLRLKKTTALSLWDVSKVIEFDDMFHGAAQFDKDVSGWKTVKGTTFARMFKDATSFNCDVSKWRVNAATTMTSMFENSGLDRTMCGKWESLNALENSNGRYGCCNAGSYMFNPQKNPFVLSDDGGSCKKCEGLKYIIPNSDTACPELQGMVDEYLVDEAMAIVKYGPISEWDVSRVTSGSNLFHTNAKSFNAGRFFFVMK